MGFLFQIYILLLHNYTKDHIFLYDLDNSDLQEEIHLHRHLMTSDLLDPNMIDRNYH